MDRRGLYIRKPRVATSKARETGEIATESGVDTSHNAVLVVNGPGGDDQISMPTLVGSSARVLYGSATLDLRDGVETAA